MNEFQKGTVEGTGSPINIELGWLPDRVKIYNIDSAAIETLEWVNGMGAATGFKFLGTSSTTRAKLTTLGISEYAGVLGVTGKGFTIGADTDLNVSAQTILWVAERGGQGASS